MRVYLDSMVWIYAVEGNPTFAPAAQSVFRQITAARHTVIASHLILAEVLVLPIREGDAHTVSAYQQLLLDSRSVELAPFEAAAALAFAHIRATHRLTTPDALHLALASTALVDLFITTDRKLLGKTYTGIAQIAHFQNARL